MTKPPKPSHATVAPSAAPPSAVPVWCDARKVYIQFPSLHGPCVLSYPRDTKGLSDLLALLATRADTIDRSPTAPIHAPARDPKFTPRQRDMVAELMRKKGIGR